MRNGALTLHCGFRAKDRCSRLELAMCNSMASLHICHQHVCPAQAPASCASCTLLPMGATPADGWLRRSRRLGRPRVSAAAGGLLHVLHRVQCSMRATFGNARQHCHMFPKPHCTPP